VDFIVTENDEVEVEIDECFNLRLLDIVDFFAEVEVANNDFEEPDSTETMDEVSLKVVPTPRL